VVQGCHVGVGRLSVVSEQRAHDILQRVGVVVVSDHAFTVSDPMAFVGLDQALPG
jgi:hypothetical protein